MGGTADEKWAKKASLESFGVRSAQPNTRRTFAKVRATSTRHQRDKRYKYHAINATNNSTDCQLKICISDDQRRAKDPSQTSATSCSHHSLTTWHNLRMLLFNAISKAVWYVCVEEGCSGRQRRRHVHTTTSLGASLIPHIDTSILLLHTTTFKAT